MFVYGQQHRDLVDRCDERITMSASSQVNVNGRAQFLFEFVYVNSARDKRERERRTGQLVKGDDERMSNMCRLIVHFRVNRSSSINGNERITKLRFRVLQIDSLHFDAKGEKSCRFIPSSSLSLLFHLLDDHSGKGNGPAKGKTSLIVIIHSSLFESRRLCLCLCVYG